MTHKQCTCMNCGDSYSHQTSGHGCGDQPSSGSLCGTCNTAVKAALAKIPKKREWVWVPVTDEAERVAAIAEWDRIDQIYRDRPPSFSGIPRRVDFPLFDMTTGKVVSRTRTIELGRDLFIIQRYIGDSQPAVITKEMVKILATGEIVPR